MKSTVVLLTMFALVLVPRSEAGMDLDRSLHLRPMLVSPVYLNLDPGYAFEAAAQFNEADVLSARGVAKIEPAGVVLFGDVGEYDPAGGDAEPTFQVGGMLELTEYEGLQIAIRAALGYPVFDDGDIFTFLVDAVALWVPEDPEELSIYFGLGAGYYDANADREPDEDGIEPVLTAGADYQVNDLFSMGAGIEYIDDFLYGLRLRLSF